MRLIHTMPVVTDSRENFGIAVSRDAEHAAVSHQSDTISVYSLPGGEHIRTFGSTGAGQAQFSLPARMCFTATGSLLVAENRNHRIQEVTLAGDHVRFIGVGAVDDGMYCAVDTNDELIVTAKSNSTTNDRVLTFDVASGALLRAFGVFGTDPGQLMKFCAGVRFTAGDTHIAVAQRASGSGPGRVGLFTVEGGFVSVIGGKHDLKCATDVEFADNGDMVVVDCVPMKVFVYSHKGDAPSSLQHVYDSTNCGAELRNPYAVVKCDGLWYLLEWNNKRVLVFEECA